MIRALCGLVTAACLGWGCSVLDGPRTRTRAASSDHGPSEGGAADAPAGRPCGKIPTVGCCDGETLWWCAQGTLRSKSCAGLPFCGWSSSGVYACNTGGAADPADKHGKLCRALVGDLGLPSSDGAADGGACQGIPREGCCAGNTLRYCEAGKLQTLDCQLNPRCGWLANGQYYDCGTAGKADPDGTFIKPCPGTTAADLGPDLKADLKPPDSAADSEATAPGQGCNCNTAAGSPGQPWLLLAVVMLLGRRRGRVSSSCS